MHAAHFLPQGSAALARCGHHRNLFCVPEMWQRICLRVGENAGDRSRIHPDGPAGGKSHLKLPRQNFELDLSVHQAQQCRATRAAFRSRRLLRPGLANGIRQLVSVTVFRSRRGRWGGEVQHSHVGTAILVALILGHTFPVIHFIGIEVLQKLIYFIDIEVLLKPAFQAALVSFGSPAAFSAAFSRAELSFEGRFVLAPALSSSVERTMLPLSLKPLLRSCWALALIRS